MRGAIYEACRTGNLKTLQGYITINNVDDIVDGHNTAAEICCIYDQVVCFRWLAEYAYSNLGKCLIISISNYNANIVKFLLQTGRADANAIDTGGWIPLHHAFRYPHIIEILLPYTHNVDLESNNGLTPLACSLLCSNRDAAQILMDNRARIENVALPGGRVPQWAHNYQIEVDQKRRNSALALKALMCVFKKKGVPKDATVWAMREYFLPFMRSDKWIIRASKK